MFTFHRTSDTLSPSLSRALRRAQERHQILEAAGQALVSSAKQAFREPGLRPQAWARRKGGGSHQLLLKSSSLWWSLGVTRVDNSSVTVGSDRKYAAIHQLGGVIRPKKAARLVFRIDGKLIMTRRVQIPARPFFPITGGGRLTADGTRRVEAAIRKKLGLA